MTVDTLELATPLLGARFGGRVRSTGAAGAPALVAAAERDPAALPQMLAASGGLLLLTGMDAMVAAPELLVRLSRIFGPEVENYRETLTSPTMVHDRVP